ncbi:prepilin peptidase [Pontibacillus yanchengensis]|uniref:Prepilin peptidase n=1 Tax=Pontibacillus yanchengensis Y32 TaxID=1385514 RepID=A0A0A2TDJ9_9BACI|nr:A24 family peptidase [Pontibacillus yanchengensis]KGP73882.1 prepilin peptidase [Pontibacillus yanchengensis Y32]
MIQIIPIHLFILGLILGSFYNVIGLRVPKSEGFFTSRSSCPYCGKSLKWFELIPVVSFFLQRGECRSCNKSISILYPFVEVCTSFLFVSSLYVFGWSIELIVSLLFISLSMIIFVSDIKYMVIPDSVLLFFLPFFLVLRIFNPLQPWYDSILGAIVGVVLLAIIIIISKGGMGAGDMKFFGLIGIVLGVKKTLLSFFLSTLTGAVVSGILLGVGIIERNNPIPFGPYIIVGAIMAHFFGDEIIHWYISIVIR